MRKAIAIALLTSLLAVGSAAAALVPQANVPALVKASDLIVVGHADQVQIQAAGETFVVWVDRVIARTATPPGRLPVQLSLPASGLGAVENGQYGIFFLRQQGGTYTAADPYHPALVAAPGGKQSTAVASVPLTGTANELTRVLTTPAATLIGLRDPSAAQHLYWEAASALETIPSDITGPSLQSIASSGRTQAALWAVAVLIYTGDANDTASRAANYLAPVQADLLKPGPDESAAVAKLAVSIQAKVNSPNAVPILATLLGSTEMVVRRGAANALARIATPEVIAPLATTALNDPEQDVRYYAVRGLAQASGAAVPTMPSFYANEAQTLSYWRNWAKTNVH